MPASTYRIYGLRYRAFPCCTICRRWPTGRRLFDAGQSEKAAKMPDRGTRVQPGSDVHWVLLRVSSLLAQGDLHVPTSWAPIESSRAVPRSN